MEQTHEEIIEQRVSDFMHSFKSGPGLRICKYLSVFCLEKETTYVEGSEMKTAFNEGARSVILEIRRWLDYDLTKLRKEQDYGEDRIS